MSRVEVRPEGYSYVFNPYRAPVARVKPGDEVVLYTNDAFESRIKTEADLPSRALADAKFLNPQTGPIYIDGAEPGDTLAVLIEGIDRQEIPETRLRIHPPRPRAGGLQRLPMSVLCFTEPDMPGMEPNF